MSQQDLVLLCAEFKRPPKCLPKWKCVFDRMDANSSFQGAGVARPKSTCVGRDRYERFNPAIAEGGYLEQYSGAGINLRGSLRPRPRGGTLENSYTSAGIRRRSRS